MLDSLTYKQFGNRAILIEWPADISEEILRDILRFKDLITSKNLHFIEDCITGYNSLTIVYLKDIVNFNSEKESLKSLYLIEPPNNQSPSNLWKIPVCYDTEFGIDLEDISSTLKLSMEEILELHSKAIYTVYFIGFLPGFLYLGGLDDRLEVQRKPNPRLQVDQGSVAIGGSQTGVYPMDSAGGWNIIGKTPLSFFNLDYENPCFAKPGDKIQFVPISLEEFKHLESQSLVPPSRTLWNG